MSFATFLLDRARSFRPDQAAPMPCARMTPHHVAIATEIGLKAYLAHQGASDSWLVTHIRHDLAHALDAAERLGLADGGAGRALVAQLDPHFRKGAFQHLREPFWQPGFETVAVYHVDALLVAVASELRSPPQHRMDFIVSPSDYPVSPLPPYERP